VLNILATPHRKRAVAAANAIIARAADQKVPVDQITAPAAGLSDLELRGVTREIQRRSDESAAAVRAKTSKLVAGALVATAGFIEAKIREQADPDVASDMADWLETANPARPFWADPDFVAAFGAARRVDLETAVDELWRRAEHKAEAARIHLPHNSGRTERHEQGIDV
jgi:hypothetical protein